MQTKIPFRRRTDREMLESLQRRVEQLILRTPSGESRNELTKENILLMNHLSEQPVSIPTEFLITIGKK